MNHFRESQSLEEKGNAGLIFSESRSHRAERVRYCLANDDQLLLILEDIIQGNHLSICELSQALDQNKFALDSLK